MPSSHDHLQLGPNPNDKAPLKGFPQVGFLKNLLPATILLSAITPITTTQRGLKDLSQMCFITLTLLAIN